MSYSEDRLRRENRRLADENAELWRRQEELNAQLSRMEGRIAWLSRKLAQAHGFTRNKF